MDSKPRWSLRSVVGITTAIREQPTLNTTVKSLKNSGLRRLHLFSDFGFDNINEMEFIKIRRRERVYGAWSNWFYALKEMRETYDQDYYAIFQDDIIVSRYINQYLYYTTPNYADCFSIFCPSIYRGVNRWNRQDKGSGLWMAQTFVFTKEATDSILNSQEVWRVPGDKCIDNRVGLWAKYNDRGVYYHTPSLVQHIGDSSTLWQDVKAEGLRAASDFVGEDFDTLKLLDD